MADPETLLDLRVAQRDAAVIARNEAETAHGTAQGALVAARAAHGAALADQAAAERQVDDARRQLAAPGLEPADAAALADLLRDRIIAHRAATAAALDADRALAEADAALSAATALAASAAARHARAEHDQAVAADRAARLQAWRDALAAPPLATLAADAQAALVAGAEPLTGATARIEADLPAPLRVRAAARDDRARARAAAEAAAARAAADQRDAALAADGGVVGALAPLASAFARAETDFERFVRFARGRYQQALVALAAERDALPLTDDQRAHLHDASQAADRETAAERAGDLEAARAAREDAERAIEAQRRALAGEDVDTTIGDDHPQLAPLIAALPPLEQAEATAAAAFTTDMAVRLDRWEAAVPDTLWQRPIAYRAARATLEAAAVPDPDPAALDAALTQAEAAYVAALVAADRRRRTHEHLDRTAERQQALADADARTARAAVLSAVRGDR